MTKEEFKKHIELIKQAVELIAWRSSFLHRGGAVEIDRGNMRLTYNNSFIADLKEHDPQLIQMLKKIDDDANEVMKYINEKTEGR